MHYNNVLSMLLSIVLLGATTSALSLPTRPRYISSTPDRLDETCTFTLFHKQLRPAAAKINYMQINTLFDHANDLIIDIAHMRPRAAFNSYSRISEKRVFAIEGLLDGKNLTVRGEDGSDLVVFESDGIMWSTEQPARDAWCNVGRWDADVYDKTRQRRLDCVFPCEKTEDDEDEERVELR